MRDARGRAIESETRLARSIRRAAPANCYLFSSTHLFNVPQLVNEHVDAVGSRRRCRYGELGVVPLRHQARVHHRLRISATNREAGV